MRRNRENIECRRVAIITEDVTRPRTIAAIWECFLCKGTAHVHEHAVENTWKVFGSLAMRVYGEIVWNMGPLTSTGETKLANFFASSFFASRLLGDLWWNATFLFCFGLFSSASNLYTFQLVSPFVCRFFVTQKNFPFCGVCFYSENS